MTTVQLHTANSFPLADTVVQTLLQAMQRLGQELQVALAGANRTQAALLGGQMLQQVAMAWAAEVSVPMTDALLQALILEVVFQPLTAQDDATLVDDRFDVWIDHRVWQVEQSTAPVVFEQLLASLHAVSHGVSWTSHLNGPGRALVHAWAPLDA